MMDLGDIFGEMVWGYRRAGRVVEQSGDVSREKIDLYLQKMKEIKAFLAKEGITVHRTDYPTHQMQVQMKRMHLQKMERGRDPLVDNVTAAIEGRSRHYRKYLQVLYFMAHEVGHYIQYHSDDPNLGDSKVFETATVWIWTQKYDMQKRQATSPFTIYKELSQWHYGQRFIPPELSEDYVVAAQEALRGYFAGFVFHPSPEFLQSPQKSLMDEYAKAFGIQKLGRRCERKNLFEGTVKQNTTEVTGEFK